MDGSPPLWSFGEFQLDASLCELRCRGSRVALRRRPLELLLYLVRNRHRVVLKSELQERVWGGVVVSEAALTSAVRDLRRAVGDDGRAQETIKTHHGFGYQFVAPVSGPGAAPLCEGPPAGALQPLAGDRPECFCQQLVAFLAAQLAEPAPDALDRDTSMRLVGHGEQLHV